jgi:type III pantothenate kinase
MRLLLDLGNTRLKWAMQRGDERLASGAVAWGDDVIATLRAAWQAQPDVRRVLGASVVDAAREAEVGALISARFGMAPEWLQTPAEACGVRNAYAEPARLGIDRFLGLVAAQGSGRSPCVRVGVGTALTLDALAADGRHLGGLIAPGPQLMQQSLLDATARIRPAQAGQLRELADNTADAVVSGCWQAAAALIERFTRRMAVPLGRPPRLLLDGGDAEALLPLLDVPAELFGDSVLHGLRIWADAHPGSAGDAAMERSR